MVITVVKITRSGPVARAGEAGSAALDDPGADAAQLQHLRAMRELEWANDGVGGRCGAFTHLRTCRLYRLVGTEATLHPMPAPGLPYRWLSTRKTN